MRSLSDLVSIGFLGCLLVRSSSHRYLPFVKAETLTCKRRFQDPVLQCVRVVMH